MADYARLRCAVALLCLQAVAAPLYAQQRELPKVLAISVEGERRYREDQLLAALGVQVGATLDDQVVSRGVETLWNAFKVRANVELRQVDGGVELRLVVSEMNVDLEPRFAGNDAIDKDTLLKWALLEERGELFLFQAERVRQGHHRALDHGRRWILRSGWLRQEGVQRAAMEMRLPLNHQMDHSLCEGVIPRRYTLRAGHVSGLPSIHNACAAMEN